MIIAINQKQAQNLKEGTYYLIYNPLIKSYAVVKASKRDIAHYYSAVELEYYYWRKK